MREHVSHSGATRHREEMTAGKATAIADDGLVDGFAQGGAHGASGNGSAQRAQDAASHDAHRYAGRTGNNADGSANFPTGGCTSHDAGDPAGSACDRADSGTCLLAHGSVYDAGASTRGARGERAACMERASFGLVVKS